MPVQITSIAPILPVHEIESALPFWVDQLGFTLITTVDHEDRLGFALLAKDHITVMLQTHASLFHDDPALAERPSPAMLYAKVEDLDALIAATEGTTTVVVARRTTFYGADEVFLRVPGGAVIGFAAAVSGFAAAVAATS